MSWSRRILPWLLGPREDEWGVLARESRWAEARRRLRAVPLLDKAIALGSLAVIAAAAMLLVPLPAARGWDGRVEVGSAAITGLIVGLLLLAAQVRVQADRERRDDAREEETRRRELQLMLSLQDKLVAIDLRERDLTHMILAGKTMDRADLRGAVLEETSFFGSHLMDAKIQGARGRWAKFDSTLLFGARVEHCDLPHVSFREADLREVAFVDSTLCEACFEKANLRGARITRLRAPGADVSGATLAGAQVTDSCLADTIWRGADLGDADLHQVDLSGADLRGADLSRATLEFCDLTGAAADDTTKWPEGFDAARLRLEHVGTEPFEPYDAALITRWALQAHRGEPIDALRADSPLMGREMLGGYPWEVVRLAAGPEDDPPATVHARFGRRLARVRARKRFAASELAELAGVEEARVEAWEAGSPIRLDELGALIAATDTTPGRIFGGFRASVPMPEQRGEPFRHGLERA